jgi:hypothetical protein
MADSLSDSAVQREAEPIILARAAALLGVRSLAPGRFPLANGVEVHVDGVSPDGRVFIEAYARQGPLKGAQLKKIGQDILKLSLVRRTAETEVRTVIVLASEEAKQSIRGWLRHATEVLGIEIVVVEISDALRAGIKAAQARQVMVNVAIGDIADDVDALSSEDAENDQR